MNKYVINRCAEKSEFKPAMITKSLRDETSLSENEIHNITRRVSNEIQKMDKEEIFTSEVRELVKSSMLRNKEQGKAKEYDTISIASSTIESLITKGCSDNANMMKSPETVHKYVADSIFKQYNLKQQPKEIADAHLEGYIHQHDMEYETERGNNCIQSDLRFFIKNGVKLDGTGEHTSVASPANSLNTLINHAGQVLMASQGQMSGGQGYGYFNIFLAPFAKGMSYKDIKDCMQAFIYNLNMSYCSRGGQAVFSSINLELGVPSFLKNEPAYGPRGKVIGTYKDYDEESRLILEAIIEVISELDAQGKPHHFPNTIFILRDEFMDEDEILLKIHKLISKVPTPYLANADVDKKGGAVTYMGCRSFLGDTYTEDWDKDTLRCGNLAYVTLNLPRIAYENKDNFYKGLDKYLKIANNSLLYRRDRFIENLYQNDNLKFLRQKDENGEMYFRWENSSLSFGYNGLNEALIILGYEEGLSNKEALRKGLEIINHIKNYADKLKKETGYRYGVFASPAESTSSRFAIKDKKEYPEIPVQGDNGNFYYTNSSHVSVNSDLDLIDRIKTEIPFHKLTNTGNIMHVFLGEKPNPKALLSLTKIIKKEGGRFWAYTNDYTFCSSCHCLANSILLECPDCGEQEDIESYSRITGYYQKISPKNPNQGWTPGKKEELKDRNRYNL